MKLWYLQSLWHVGGDMTGCDDHIGAQHEELLSGLRPGNQNEWAGNKTNPSWHWFLSSLETHMATEGPLYEGGI